MQRTAGAVEKRARARACTGYKRTKRAMRMRVHGNGAGVRGAEA